MGSYARSGRFYDELYAHKDYAGEVDLLLQWVGLERGRVLDLGCGTGRHLECLVDRFEGCGVDLEEELLEVARQRLPQVALVRGDMAEAAVVGPFDLITCFFGSVGYLGSVDRLHQATRHWAGLLSPSGWLALETWIQPDEFSPQRVMALFVDQPDFKLTRMSVSRATGTLYDTDFHYLLATPEGVEHFVERHQLRMFSHQEYRTALEGAGLRWSWEPTLGMRGMYMARK
jgi:trans-aconitate methyltransferase